MLAKFGKQYGLRIGGPGGAYDDIRRVMQNNPGAQDEIFAEVSAIYLEWDQKHGTKLFSQFLANLRSDKYTKYP